MLPLNNNKIDIIEFSRFVAAMLVMCVHMPVFGFGAFGVDIFFIISGFVMMHSTESTSSSFFKKRLIRILPNYYIFTLGVFILALKFPHLLNNTTANLDHLLKSLFFIPFDKNETGHFPILFLGWTLNLEMLFYSIFALSLIINKKYRGFISSYILLTIFLISAYINSFPLKAYNDFVIFEFILGMIIYLIIFKKNYIESFLMLLAIIIGCLFQEINLNDRLLIYGLPSMIIMFLIILKFQNLKLSKLILMLGAGSYSLYLTHPYIIQFFDRFTNWFSGGFLQKGLSVFLCVVLANTFAILTYKFYELPIRRYFRKKLIK